MEKIIISHAFRTPFGKFGGFLKDISAPLLGAATIKAIINESNIYPDEISSVIIGIVLGSGLGQNIAKQSALNGGLSSETDCFNVDMVCGSSLRSVIIGQQMIKSGDSKIVIAGGVENMSQAPYLLEKARFGYKLSDGKIIDSLIHDGLWDIQSNVHMGMIGEIFAKKNDISREECDEYALLSHQKADLARKKGLLSSQMCNNVFPNDLCPREQFDEGVRSDTSIAKLSKLRPAFSDEGVLTAGNSSQISDGAASLMLIDKNTADEKGFASLGEIISWNHHGVSSQDMLQSPIECVKKLLEKNNLSVDDIDLFENNEAFSSGSIGYQRELDIDPKKLNIYGGAIAIGHPIGASGARILVNLCHALKQNGGGRGIASLCIGGGDSLSILIEQ